MWLREEEDSAGEPSLGEKLAGRRESAVRGKTRAQTDEGRAWCEVAIDRERRAATASAAAGRRRTNNIRRR